MIDKEYIEKWLSGSLTGDELRDFEKTETYRELVKLESALQQFKAPQYDVEAELERLNRQKQKKGKLITMPMLIKTITRVAAVILIAMTGYFFFYLNSSSIELTSAAEKNQFYLPDSSIVSMNAMSEVMYKKNIWKYSRTVQLDGEAFFNVAKGARFDVITDAGTVSVLGTQFNVKNRDAYFEVECFEGSVEVSSENAKRKLGAGSGIRILNGKIDEYTTRAGGAPAWLKNESAFQSIAFRWVVDEFERHYNVRFQTEDIDLDRLFTGKFGHDNLEQALQAITLPLNLKFIIKDGGHIILTAGGE